MKRILPYLAAIPILAACSQLPQREPVPDMLAYAQRFSVMSAEAQRREFSQISQEFARHRNDRVLRMKAALIYALPASRHRDAAKAQPLLAEILRDPDTPPATQALADLLQDYLVERQKLEDQLARQGQKLADEQKRNEALQQKLDELKAIERALSTRSQDGGAR